MGNAVGNIGAGTNPGAFGNNSIGGGLAAQNSIFIDGVQDNLSGNNTPLVPTQDAIQEFSVATNNVDAEFGKFGGGIINMTTKTGINSLQGGLYEYLRNKVLNANDFLTIGTESLARHSRRTSKALTCPIFCTSREKRVIQGNEPVLVLSPRAHHGTYESVILRPQVSALRSHCSCYRTFCGLNVVNILNYGRKNPLTPKGEG